MDDDCVIGRLVWAGILSCAGGGGLGNGSFPTTKGRENDPMFRPSLRGLTSNAGANAGAALFEDRFSGLQSLDETTN